MIGEFNYEEYASYNPRDSSYRDPWDVRKQMKTEAIYDIVAFLRKNLKIKEKDDKYGTSFLIHLVVTDKDVSIKI